MATYRVRVIHEVANGMANGTNRMPMVLEVVSPDAVTACRLGVEALRAEGWPGVFRWPTAENVEDGHDVAVMTW